MLHLRWLRFDLYFFRNLLLIGVDQVVFAYKSRLMINEGAYIDKGEYEVQEYSDYYVKVKHYIQHSCYIGQAIAICLEGRKREGLQENKYNWGLHYYNNNKLHFLWFILDEK